MRRRFYDILEVFRDERVELVSVFLVLILASGAFLPLLTNEAFAGGAVGNPLIQAVWFVMYLVFLLLVLVHWRPVLATALRGKWLLALVALAVVSVFWSSVPELTLRRGVALSMTTLAGIYLAARFGLRAQLRMLAGVLGLLAACSLLAVLLFPGIAVDSDIHEGAWQGVFVQKNTFGRFMTLGVLVFFFAGASRILDRRLAWTGLAGSLCLALLSTSATALLSLTVFTGIVAVYLLFRYRGLVLATSTLGTGLAGLVLATLMANVVVIFGLSGTGFTLTGRTGLWDVILSSVREQPLLGYGYGAFWLGEDGPSREVWQFVTWEPNHAHNGLLELVLYTGLLGLAVFLAGLTVYAARALLWTRVTGRIQSLWPLSFLAVFFLMNITQSELVYQHEMFWILYVSTMLAIPVSLRNRGGPVKVPKRLRRASRVR